MQDFEFLVPHSLEEACRLLAEHGESCRLIAGGTDVVPALREGRLGQVEKLIDIRRQQELRGIKETDDGVWIGAATTHTEIAGSLEVKRHWGLLADACGQIGSKQIRNLATIGGNVANASPAADSIPALICLDARVRLLSTEGSRELPLQEYVWQNKEVTNELILGFTLPSPPDDAKSAFVKVARRQAMAISRLSLAVSLRIRNERVDFVRLVPGAMLPITHHLDSVEQYLRGRILTPATIEAVTKLATQSVIAETGMRSSFAYKVPVLEGLITRVLEQFREGVESRG